FRSAKRGPEDPHTRGHGMRSMTAGSVRKVMIRMAPPHCGQCSGSTSKIRRNSSAQRRRASWSGSGTGTANTTGGARPPSVPSVRRRIPRVRFAYQP
ncbi:MAG: hypothetical protein ACHQ50_16560, partial [Fimbriimonadales bacterium]